MLHSAVHTDFGLNEMILCDKGLTVRKSSLFEISSHFEWSVVIKDDDYKRKQTNCHRKKTQRTENPKTESKKK